MSRIDQGITPIGFVVRVMMGTTAAILALPFVMLAVAPMVLVLTPVAFVALPFLVSAFAGEAREVATPRRVPLFAKHAHAH
jgi:hypothetical protein